MTIESIIGQALSLAPRSRAYLAEILLESLDYEEDVQVSEAWQQEIKKRCQEIDANPAILIDGNKLVAELKQLYL